MQDKNENEELLSIGEASEFLGVSIDTLRRWEKKGRVEAYRSPGDHRYFKKETLKSLFGRKYTRDEETERRKSDRVIEDKILVAEATENLIDSVKFTGGIEIPPVPTSYAEAPPPPPPGYLQDTPSGVARNQEIIPVSSILEPEKKAEKSNKKTNYLFWALGILGFIALDIILFIIWRTSTQILSPIP